MNNIRNVTRFGGIATGLDTETMVRDMVRAEKVRVDRLVQNRTQLEWRRADMRTLNTALTTFRNRTFDMTLPSTYRRFSVSSSNERAVTATATGGAVATQFEFTGIERLATAARASSSASIVTAPHTTIDPTATIGQLISEGSTDGAGLPSTFAVTVFNHNAAGERVAETFTVDTAVDTLNSVLERINNTRSLGIQSFYDSFSGRVSLTSRFSGNTNALGADMGFEGEGEAFFTQTLRLGAQDGANTRFTVNGLATERPSNTFTINGVSFTLRDTLAAGQSARVSVNPDTDAVVRRIEEFVNFYNDTLGQINTALTAERNRDYLPLTDEQKEAMRDEEVTRWQERARSGLLRGNDLLERVVSRLRRDFNDPLPDGALRQMSLIGIRTGHHAEGGRLQIDATRLRAELERDPAAVESLFIGVAQRVRASLSTGIRELTAEAGSATGLTSADRSVIGQQMQRISVRIERENDRIGRVEERLWRQFTSLERAMERMNSQSAWLAQQFANGQ